MNRVVGLKEYTDYMTELNRDGVGFRDTTVWGFCTLRKVFGGWNVSRNISKAYIFDEDRAVDWAEDKLASGGDESERELAKEIIAYVKGE